VEAAGAFDEAEVGFVHGFEGLEELEGALGDGGIGSARGSAATRRA
jgi:hypothetical protein